MVDAPVVGAPRQRKTPKEWDEKPSKKRQKDEDARWATKDKELHYGYKARVKIDKKRKIITRFGVTGAGVHDSQELRNLADKKEGRLYGDSAYTGEEVQSCISKKAKNRIRETGCRGRPLTRTQMRNNIAKSKIRARVEHIFGMMTNSRGGIIVRGIGKARAEGDIALMNLAYI
jgi:IS5 family transposase